MIVRNFVKEFQPMDPFPYWYGVNLTLALFDLFPEN